MSITASSCIMRTTVDIDDPILREVKAIHEKEGRSMGAIVSELLAEALTRRRAACGRPAFRWTSRPMKAVVDLTDKDALYAILDADRSCAIALTSTSCSTHPTDARHLVADAQLAAILFQNGVGRLYSNDRDFRKFKSLEVHDRFE